MTEKRKIDMDRSEITELLTKATLRKIDDNRGYAATEVTLNYGSAKPKRIDVMEFKPMGVFNLSDIEKGVFTCYEIKSCMADVYSGNGLNFYGDKNYIVTTMETYKKLQIDILNGKFRDHLKEIYDEVGESVPDNYGVYVLVPDVPTADYRKSDDLKREYDNPTVLSREHSWKLIKMIQSEGYMKRNKSIIELLFCMLRSGK